MESDRHPIGIMEATGVSESGSFFGCPWLQKRAECCGQVRVSLKSWVSSPSSVVCSTMLWLIRAAGSFTGAVAARERMTSLLLSEFGVVVYHIYVVWKGVVCFIMIEVGI